MGRGARRDKHPAPLGDLEAQRAQREAEARQAAEAELARLRAGLERRARS